MMNKEMVYKKDRDIEVLKEGYENGVRYIIMSLGTHPCIYIGVEENHPLANFDYDDMPISCHYGLTYSNKGDGEYLPEGYWWYGWDYAHAGDYCGYYENKEVFKNETKWTLKELERELWEPTWELSKLKKIAERIVND